MVHVSSTRIDVHACLLGNMFFASIQVQHNSLEPKKEEPAGKCAAELRHRHCAHLLCLDWQRGRSDLQQLGRQQPFPALLGALDGVWKLLGRHPENRLRQRQPGLKHLPQRFAGLWMVQRLLVYLCPAVEEYIVRQPVLGCLVSCLKLLLVAARVSMLEGIFGPRGDCYAVVCTFNTST